MARHKNNVKKTSAQARKYREFVANIDTSPLGTTVSTNSMLVGTEEKIYENDKLPAKEDILKTPLKYRLIDWLKKNVFAEIIVAAVIAIGAVTISHMVKVAVIENRIDYVEKQLEIIEVKSIDRDYFMSQLELLKSEINGENNILIKDIEWQLKDIENRIVKLEKE